MSVASVATGSLSLHDAKANRSFLIDTGAEVSVVPATEDERRRTPMQEELVAANGSRIRCYGEKKIQLQVGSRNYEWTFLVADVRRPLIGADFLTHSSLLVDLQNNQLVHPEEMITTPLQRTKRKAKADWTGICRECQPIAVGKVVRRVPDGCGCRTSKVKMPSTR